MLLLDTHVLYWFLRDDVKLPGTIKELISTERALLDMYGNSFLRRGIV